MARAMSSTALAVKAAVTSAAAASPPPLVGTVTAWANPKATVLLEDGTIIPRVRATQEAAANIIVTSRVILTKHGSIAIITGTI